MAKVIMKAQGLDGVMILMNDRVVLHRPGLWNFFKYGRDAKHEIPFAAISEVVFKPATMMSQGELELVRSGRSREDRKFGHNANAMRFRKRDNAQFEALKEKIFEAMNAAPRR